MATYITTEFAKMLFMFVYFGKVFGKVSNHQFTDLTAGINHIFFGIFDKKFKS